MNLLDILSAGKSPLNEQNISSLLAWLLDPGQSHGYGPLLLKRLLIEIDSDKFSKVLSYLNYYVAYRENHKFNVSVLMENRVLYTEKDKRDIDVVIIINIFESTGTEESYILAIENKIREGSTEEQQLADEYKGLEKEYPNSKICFLYLTPRKSTKSSRIFQSLPSKIIKRHMTWADKVTDKERSFVDLLREILNDDNEARINPLSQEVRFVIKSFIVFAENGFVSQREQVQFPDNNKAPRSRYFKGVVSGLEGVNDIAKSGAKVFIGYDGGKIALKRANLEYLQNRYYKWDDSLTGKDKANWIPIAEFLTIIKEKT